MSGQLHLVDNEALTLIAEAENRDRVLIVLRKAGLILVGRLLSDLYLQAPVMVVVVVRVQKPDFFAVFIFAKLYSSAGHLLNHLIQ